MSTIVKEILDDSERIMNFHESANVKPEMVKYGYTEAKMTEGKTLLASTRAACDRQAREYGEQLQANITLENHLKKCGDTYAIHIEAARFVLRDRTDAQSTLELNGRRSRTASGSYNQMVNFYERLTANDSWTAAMGKLLFTPEILNAQKAELVQIRKYKDDHSREMGEAQQATIDRDALLEKLDQWVYDYIKVARFALAATPQLLEGLKVTVRSTPKAPSASTVQRDDL